MASISLPCPLAHKLINGEGETRLVKTKDALVVGGAKQRGEAECGSEGSGGRDRGERAREAQGQGEGEDGGERHRARHGVGEEEKDRKDRETWERERVRVKAGRRDKPER